MKIAIIGAGNVGGSLGKAWAKAGHYIIFGVRNPGQGKTQPPLAEIGVGATAVTLPDAARTRRYLAVVRERTLSLLAGDGQPATDAYRRPNSRPMPRS